MHFKSRLICWFGRRIVIWNSKIVAFWGRLWYFGYVACLFAIYICWERTPLFTRLIPPILVAFGNLPPHPIGDAWLFIPRVMTSRFPPPHLRRHAASLEYLPWCIALVRVQGGGEPQRHLACETFARPGIDSRVYPWAVYSAGSAFFCLYFPWAPYGPEIIWLLHGNNYIYSKLWI